MEGAHGVRHRPISYARCVPTPLALADLLPALPQGAEWLSILLSYLLGAVPFGWLMARLLKGVDIREIGSGNIGATNAMRALGKPLGLVAFLLDFGKGLLPSAALAPLGVHLVPHRSELVLALAYGGCAIAGHLYPIYLRFHGGKGVATSAGVLTGAATLPVVIAAGVWVISRTQ